MNSFLYIAIAMAAGLLLTRVVKLVNLPNVTGYLVAGLLIGPSCFGLLPVEATGQLTVITTVALGFIAFSIGGEFKFSYLKLVGKKISLITLFESGLPVIAVDLILILCGVPVPMALALGAIAAATAPAATLMVVRQYKANGPVTRTLLPVVAMDDATSLMFFSISIAIAPALATGEKISLYSMLLSPLVEIGLSLLIGAAVGGVLALATRFYHSRANRLPLCVAAVFLGVGLAELLNLSSLLLCMAVGLVFVNFGRDPEKVMDFCEQWTPPLYMLFFVISGAQLEISILPSVGLAGVLYILVRSAGKFCGAGLGSRIVKAEPTVRKYLGLTLLPQAGVAIGLAQLSMTRLPEYGAQIRAVILCATLIYELLGPAITKTALTAAGEIEKKPKKEKAPAAAQ